MSKAKVCAAFVTALAAGSLVAPFAASADTPTGPGPGCRGRIVATFNHASGEFGASGNPNASAGPGYFLKQDTAEVVHLVQDAFCP